MNLGNIYQRINDFETALYYHQNSMEILLENLGDSHPELAASYNNMATIFSLLHDHDNSLHYNDLAKNIWVSNFGESDADIARWYLRRAMIGSCEGLSRIDSLFEKALNIRIESFGEKHPMTTEIRNHYGVYLNKNKNFHKANSQFLYSFYSNNLDINDEHSFNNILSYDDVLYSYKNLIKNHNDLFTLEGNSIFLDSAILYSNHFENYIDYLTNSVSNIYLQNEFLNDTKKVYQNSIATLLYKLDLSDQYIFNERIFGYQEKSKSNLLKHGITESNALQYAGIPDSLLQKEYDLRIDITYYDKKRQEKLSEGLEETDTTVLAISSKLFDLNREYEALKERFETDYPDYYKLKYDLSTVSLGYVQDTLLTADQTLLEYFVGDSSIFIFTVGKDKYDVVEVKRDFPLEDWVKQLQNGLTGYYTQPLAQRTDDLYKETIQQYIEASQQLYGKLVAPVKEQLNTSELIIVPDGLLGYVPFGALLSGQPKRASVFDTYPFLEKDYKISYCYSATLLREMKEKQHKRQPTGSLVAFAPFYEGSYELLDTTFSLTFDTLANGQDTLIFNDVVTRKDFNNLPASGEEVKAASLFWNGDYYLNADATEDRFNEVAGNYRIVHLSTHGVADSRSGDYSYLAFAEQKDSLENEFLYVRDLYNTQLNADLVTLSACETAAGELQRGEGIISLARAFAYAGAKSIVTTLWVADDSATKDLMKVFYQQLKNGEAKDASLQSAKLGLLKNRGYSHPFFWAGFVPVGDMQALD
ncbi:MAG: CHAT domain-containing tetratricopeptide repeat protein [Saprospiraceae bacterium]